MANDPFEDLKRLRGKQPRGAASQDTLADPMADLNRLRGQGTAQAATRPRIMPPDGQPAASTAVDPRIQESARVQPSVLEGAVSDAGKEFWEARPRASNYFGIPALAQLVNPAPLIADVLGIEPREGAESLLPDLGEQPISSRVTPQFERGEDLSDIPLNLLKGATELVPGITSSIAEDPLALVPGMAQWIGDATWKLTEAIGLGVPEKDKEAARQYFIEHPEELVMLAAPAIHAAIPRAKTGLTRARGLDPILEQVKGETLKESARVAPEMEGVESLMGETGRFRRPLRQQKPEFKKDPVETRRQAFEQEAIEQQMLERGAARPSLGEQIPGFPVIEGLRGRKIKRPIKAELTREPTLERGTEKVSLGEPLPGFEVQPRATARPPERIGEVQRPSAGEVREAPTEVRPPRVDRETWEITREEIKDAAQRFGEQEGVTPAEITKKIMDITKYIN